MEEKEKQRKKKAEGKATNKKSPIFDLQGMLNDFKKKEEKNILNIKQRQKNEIFQQMETKIKNTIIKNKSEMIDENVKKKHNERKERKI